jgi:hypothetical protein
MIGVTGIFSIAGFLLILLYYPSSHFSSADSLKNAHVKIGLIMFILMFGQFILGFVSNHYFDPSRKNIPVIDKVIHSNNLKIGTLVVGKIIGTSRNRQRVSWIFGLYFLVSNQPIHH